MRASIEFLNVAFGAVLFTNGLGLMLLAAILRSDRNLELPAFGAGLFLFGLRTLSDLESTRALVPLSGMVWDYVGPICLYFLTVTTFVFMEHYWGAGRFGSFRRIWQIQLAFAVGGTATDIASGTPGAAMDAYLLLVLVWTAVVLLNVAGGNIRSRPEDRIVVVGLVVIVLTVIHDSLVLLGAIWSVSLQPLGILVFSGSLTYSLVLRSFGNERRLAMIDVELQTARRFQQSLLPHGRPPVPEGACAVRFRPMAAVGGDLYDFLPVDGRRFGILVADVSGHGIPAALIASMVKTAAASQARVAARPAELLAGMNRHLYRQLDGNLVTAVYACVDPDARRVSLANAGHPRPLLLASGGRSASEAGERGAALGLLPDERYAATDLSLAPGDRLVLYSDGLVEAKAPDGALFEVQRLRSALNGRAALPAAAWADHVLDEVTRWVGKPDLTLDDDLTLVVLDMPAGDAGAS